MMQTRWQSFFESCINVAIGYGVALLSQIIVFPSSNLVLLCDKCHQFVHSKRNQKKEFLA